MGQKIDLRILPPVVCEDGTCLSVQASKYHYCLPRDDSRIYTHFEIGYITGPDGMPLTPPDTWMPYADGQFPNDVYGYVPVDLVREFIKAHGGLAASASITGVKLGLVAAPSQELVALAQS